MKRWQIRIAEIPVLEFTESHDDKAQVYEIAGDYVEKAAKLYKAADLRDYYHRQAELMRVGLTNVVRARGVDIEVVELPD